MSYQPPVDKILLAMKVAGRLETHHDLVEDDAAAILNEAGRFAAERIVPLNRVGDKSPSELINGKVVTPPGWLETYRDWSAAGWGRLSSSPEFGGQGLPMLMAVACTELWNAASISFALCPLLTMGAIEAITHHASENLKQRYLPNMISGEWTGTMNLTEPQSGSDLSGLRCKARRLDDNTYRITGQKIFITYGEHDLTSNIVHLVLARLEGAPEGSRGISLFLVPKVLPGGTSNDLRCHSLEHKLGIHGSPTCTMIYGDNGGATGWLIGEENRGLNCMFTMMNNARLMVGVQGVAIAERTFQAAVDFAKERRQGRAPGAASSTSPIIAHPDVRRMLLDMRCKTNAARMLCMATASAIDDANRADEEGLRARARAALLTPLAKAYATDIAVEVASSAVQVCGGMGYIEETGVAQFYRDARILPIYEGTNGIQAIDLVTRKLGLEGGQTLQQELDACDKSLREFAGDSAAETMKRLREAIMRVATSPGSAESLAVATPILRALATALAAGWLANAAKVAAGEEVAAARPDAEYFLATEVQTALAAIEGAISCAAITGRRIFT